MRLKYLLNSVKYKIWSYFWYRSPIYICLNPFKIFRFWWKARKDFLKPEIVKHKLKRGDSLNSDYFYLDTNVNNKWLHINFEGCEWKSKFGDVRFEAVPYIIIVLLHIISPVIAIVKVTSSLGESFSSELLPDFSSESLF